MFLHMLALGSHILDRIFLNVHYNLVQTTDACNQLFDMFSVSKKSCNKFYEALLL